MPNPFKKDEINYLLLGGEPNKELVRKAQEHAISRLLSGRSPFAAWGEQK